MFWEEEGLVLRVEGVDEVGVVGLLLLGLVFWGFGAVDVGRLGGVGR